MKVFLALLGMAMILAGCCGFTGGPNGVAQSGGSSGLNSCLSDCNTNSVGTGGFTGLKTCQAYCYDHDATAKLDANACDPIKSLQNDSGFDTAFWYNGCIGDVAEGKLDVSVCTKIQEGSGRDQCILNVYYKTHNPADCNGLSDPRMKSECA